MSVKTAYIISLKFAPGLKKEFTVLGENIRQRGINVRYILSTLYRELEGELEGMEYLTKRNNLKGILIETLKCIVNNKISDIFSTSPPLFICFYNPHLLNPFIARFVKGNFPNAKIALYLHEPYKPDKKPYGIVKAAYITSAEFVQALTIKYMDYVISPSEYSSYLFKMKYPKFKGENHIAPLLLPDRKLTDSTMPIYFSMIGNANRATGHDNFINLVNYASEKKLNYKFSLVSSSNITKYLKKLSRNSHKKIYIVNKEIINDCEIDQIVSKSYAVFRIDKEVTQSGVAPLSFMNGTPVIARNTYGLTQHIKHKINGYIIPYNFKLEDLINGMNYIYENYGTLSRNARQSYEEKWAEWNWDKYYDWLIKLFCNAMLIS